MEPLVTIKNRGKFLIGNKGEQIKNNKIINIVPKNFAILKNYS